MFTHACLCVCKHVHCVCACSWLAYDDEITARYRRVVRQRGRACLVQHLYEVLVHGRNLLDITKQRLYPLVRERSLHLGRRILHRLLSRLFQDVLWRYPKSKRVKEEKKKGKATQMDRRPPLPPPPPPNRRSLREAIFCCLLPTLYARHLIRN